MITTASDDAPFRTTVTNGRVRITADVQPDRGGRGDGLRPHELLEAALAACMNISVRLEAAARGLGPVEVRTTVQLDRAGAAEVGYRFACRVEGRGLTAPGREALRAAARGCELGRTLLRGARLVEDPALEPAP